MEDLSKLEQPETSTRKDTLLEKYGIPIHYLDYKYVENCRNGRELEKILHILQSGEEGYFPDLIQKTEEKLAKIKPNSRFIRKVSPVISKEFLNKDEREMLSEDLNKWLSDVNKNNEELGKVKNKKCSKELPEVRKAVKEVSEENKASEKRIKSTDYSSWEKYDPDTEILKMDLEAQKLKTKLEIEEKGIKKDRMVKFNEFQTTAEAKFEADREREKGNEYFKAAEYKEALTHYTNSINFLPSAANYNNRAITNIKLKKYENAIKDCTSALKYEPKNIKALIRLAQSYEALKNYTDAICSAQKAVQIDPNNTIAQNLINKLNKFIVGEVKSTKTRMKIVEIKENGEENENNNEKTSGFVQKKNKVINSVVEKKSKHGGFGDRKTKRSGNQVLLPIPGPSNMPEPYFVAVENKDRDIIRRQEYILNCRRQVLHFTNVDNSVEDNDCVEIHLEKSDSKHRITNNNNQNMNFNMEGINGNTENSNGNSVLLGELNGNEDDEITKGVIIEEWVDENKENIDIQKKESKFNLVKIDELEEENESYKDVPEILELNIDNNSDAELCCKVDNEENMNENVSDESITSTESEISNFGTNESNAVSDQYVENNSEIRSNSNSLVSVDTNFRRDHEDFDVLENDVEELIRVNIQSQTGGGGEPHVNNGMEIMPVDTSYSFRRQWDNIDSDDTHGQRAEILRSVNLNRLPRVIGYELDGTMLSQILKTLYQHFQVVHEIERVYILLENLTTVRRFNLGIMFMDEDDKNKLKSLIAFLEQHGKPLPAHVKRLYGCN